jgi:oxygen-independent coproporphyrinogen-3 oxidase
MNNKISLYIHIPFCKKKCNYCDFVSYQNQESLIDAYVESLLHEIEMVSEQIKKYKIKTIFIGGGTPSYLSAENISKIVNKCREILNLEELDEFSIEVNPGTIDENKLTIYRRLGISRLSIGLQACQNKLLKTIGRIHTYQEFLESYQLARKAGFDNINIDLIFGLPGQTLVQWRETLEEVVGLRPEHLSCYSLKVEENTPFAKMLEQKQIILLDEDVEREMYHEAIAFLKKNGYVHYEISNFSLPGKECKHNLVYWKQERYLGLGAGAHSYINEQRFSNKTNLKEYMDSVNSDALPRENFIEMNKNELISEYVILGLRLIGGVSRKEFRKKFGIEIDEIFEKQIAKMSKLRLLDSNDKRVKLTTKGLDIANQVMIEFLF